MSLRPLRADAERNRERILAELRKAGTLLAADSDSSGLLDLAFPLADYVPMRLATRFSVATFRELPDGVAITWEELGPSRTHVKLPKGSARATVTLTAAPDRRSVVMKCRIENRFSQPIPQILFPDFAGLRPVGPPQDTVLTMAPTPPDTERTLPSKSATSSNMALQLKMR